MLGLLSRRLLTLLQLTRMALVFTAISNAFCALLLRAKYLDDHGGGDGRMLLHALTVSAVAVVSVGLYAFGMSLNDIIDRRRDRLTAAHRPLPSGRIGVGAAHVVCAMMAVAALAGGGYLAWQVPQGRMSLGLVAWCLVLIAFYDLAGKYLVAPGLLALGLIRFFHAAVAAPGLPMVWHPLLLLNHVTLLSAYCYALEEKRPNITRKHWWLVGLGLAVLDAGVIGVLWHRRSNGTWTNFADALWIQPALIAPAVAAVMFVGVAIFIRKRIADRRAAGQTLMLWGLLWLIVYDVTIAMSYVSVLSGAVLLVLLPIAWLSVQLMRAWSKLLFLSTKPAYQRAR
jgi:4-hydroxybenzoate polyprenyltransferase